MKIQRLLVLYVMLVFAWAPMAFSGPEELSETQMTDMSVDDTLTTNNQKEKSTTAKNDKLPPEATHLDRNMITNPVDNPTELNKAEILRLENQAADQRVNDQIRNTLQGVPDQE
ncbi:MAG: hypothetical protein KKD44_08885 [Proteobacteria bacterium]|nr:hypothetical protein [Pseudomonadota bacterium]